MRVLLDNCMPVQAKSMFAGHEVFHVRDVGWQNLTNGTLLAAAAQAGFDVLFTIDKNIRHQQNLEKLPLAVVELDLATNRLSDIRAAATYFAAAVDQTRGFKFVSVDANGKLETMVERPANPGERAGPPFSSSSDNPTP